MKTQCPVCKKIFDIPDEYREKLIKCHFCQKKLIAILFKPPPIVVPAKKIFLAKKAKNIWLKSPATLRAGFFATLGVISALFISLYLYRTIFHHSSIPNDYELAKQKLESCGLFTSDFIGSPGTLRGRILIRHNFLPDATRREHCLSIWFDEKNNLVGISAYWMGNVVCFPADIEGENLIYFNNKAVCEGFELLTSFFFKEVKDCDFIEEDDPTKPYTHHFYKNRGEWLIIISRKACMEQGTGNHEFACNLSLKSGNMSVKDYGVYDFIATAHNW